MPAPRPSVSVLPFLLPPLIIASLLHGGPGSGLAAVLAEAPAPERTAALGPLQADRRDVPLVRATALLDQKFRQLSRAGLLRDLPTAFTLDLRVDVAGAVTAIAFDRPTGRAGKLLETQMVGWRMEAWTAAGPTLLQVPVQLAP
jgi:hypothetical protein